MIYLIIVFAVFYSWLSWKRLDWAVMLLIVALPSYLIRFSILGIPFTLLELMILLSFFVWLLKYTNLKNFLKGNYKLKDFRKNRKKRIKYPFRLEIIFLLLVSYLAIAIAGFSDAALGIWKAYFFEPILVFILVLNIFKGSNFKKILISLSVSALLVSLFAIFQKATGLFISNDLWAAEETRRVTSFFSYPNAVGLFLGPIFFSSLGLLVIEIKNKSKKLFLLLTATIILSLLSIYFARSEGALIGILAGLVILGILWNKKTRWATLALILLSSFVVMLNAPARDYALKKIMLQDLSGQIRLQQWRETWQMLTDGKLFWGSGLAGYQEAVAPFHQEGIFFNKFNDPEFHRHVVWNDEYKKEVWQPVEIYLYPHNIFLNFWTELGLLGMVLFVWIFAKYFYTGLKNFIVKNIGREDRYLTLGLIGAMVAMVVHGLVDVPYFKNDLSVMFWIFVAVLSILNLRKNDGTIETR